MDAMEVILARRSIRSYTSQPVPKEVIEELLKAGMAAPSADNKQPWHFVVIDDGKILNQIPKFHPYSKMLKEASVAILVCGHVKSEKHKGFWVQDCSAATQNILLAVEALGLGAVWLGIYPQEDLEDGIKKLLELPEHIVPLSLIPVGYKGEHKPPAERYDASRVHHNKW
jgi:nitroreductase